MAKVTEQRNATPEGKGGKAFLSLDPPLREALSVEALLEYNTLLTCNYCVSKVSQRLNLEVDSELLYSLKSTEPSQIHFILDEYFYELKKVNPSAFESLKRCVVENDGDIGTLNLSECLIFQSLGFVQAVSDNEVEEGLRRERRQALLDGLKYYFDIGDVMRDLFGKPRAESNAHEKRLQPMKPSDYVVSLYDGEATRIRFRWNSVAFDFLKEKMEQETADHTGA